jgi:hypothetical protein
MENEEWRMENEQKRNLAKRLFFHSPFAIRHSPFVALLIVFSTSAQLHAQPAAQSLMDLKPEPLLPGKMNSTEHHPPSEFEAEEEAKPPSHFWLNADYLLWWIKDSKIPVLLTSGSGSDPLPAALGQPGTAIIFGGGNVNNYNRSGVRFSAGYWFDDDQSFGVEGGYFFLASRSIRVDLQSGAFPGSIILGRPFVDVTTTTQDVGIIALQNLSSGSVEVISSSRLQGAEINAMAKLPLGYGIHLTGLAGFRYLQLDENINVADNEAVSPQIVLIGGDSISTIDKFAAHNRFYGGQIGVRGDYGYGRWSFAMSGKFALGGTQEVIRIQGQTSVTSATGIVVYPAGFLALATNSGRFTQDEFAFVPEVNLTVGYQITDHLRAFVGYTFLYISSVARPGDSIDLGLNPSQIPLSLTNGTLVGPVRPLASVHDTDFWAQGLNFGVEFTY